jgi:hypothetical protein
MERENLTFNSLLPPHRLLGWILGVALVISGVVLSGVVFSANAVAAYTDCVDSQPLDAINECVALGPQLAVAIAAESAAAYGSQDNLAYSAESEAAVVARDAWANTPSATVAPAGHFYLNQRFGDEGHWTESLTLMLLLGVLLAVMLVRAKSFNSK